MQAASGLLRRHSASKTRVNALIAPRNDGVTADANNLLIVFGKRGPLNATRHSAPAREAMP
jgi:hypothetical protein